MRLPNEEWLSIAKRLAVNQKTRVRHRNEQRVNLVVGNDADRWWAYCQSCKAGGVELKSHVLLQPVKETLAQRLTLPKDKVPVLALDPYLRDAVLGFLASKGMDVMFLPELWWSSSVNRILINTGYDTWIGRVMQENRGDKWLTYNDPKFLGQCTGKRVAVIVEDPFSYFKLRWVSLHYGAGVDVFCSLGTRIRDPLQVVLMKHYGTAGVFYDGDSAGYSGAAFESKRLKAFGLSVWHETAPDGKDPKDLTIQELHDYLWRVQS